MGGVDSAAETQSLYGFLSELFPKPLPRKGMETVSSSPGLRVISKTFLNHFPERGWKQNYTDVSRFGFFVGANLFPQGG